MPCQYYLPTGTEDPITATPKKSTARKPSPAADPSARAYEFHRYTDLLPETSPQEFEDLKKSIETVGLQEPVTLYEGRILDGRNRYKACLALGIEPEFSEVEVKGNQDAIDFVITRNLQRRQLTAGQRVVVALKALPEIGKAVQDDRVKKIRDAIAENRIDGTRANLPTSGKPKGKQGRRKEVRTTSIVGDLFGVSATYVRYAEALEKKDKELLDQVIQRKARLYDLYQQYCPSDAKGKGKRGPKPNPIRTGLKCLIRLVEKSSNMSAVLAKLQGAMLDLDSAQKGMGTAKG